MLRIGDFSQLAQVTVKTLRHYDEIGLLKPVWTDRYTGYRYYALQQLPRLNRILALKDLGFSLAQIAELVNQELTPDELRHIFNRKQAELEQRLQAEQARLHSVAERLQQIEREGRLPEYEVTLKSVPPLSLATRRVMVPTPDMWEERCSRLRAELLAWALANGVHTRGQWLLLPGQSEHRTQNQVVEVGLAVEASSQLPNGQYSAGIELKQLPAVERMASVLHRTGERPLNLAYTALYTWMEHNAYFSAGAPRELLLSDPAQKEEHWQFTEVQLPVHNTQEMKTKLIANPYRKDFEMEPKIVSLPAFQVVGVRYYGKNENQEISQLWQAGNQRFHEIKHITPGSDAYGICVTPPDSPTGEFEYVAGFQVDSGEDIPQGMVSRQVPAHTYAVFTHVGSLEKLRDTYTYIYQVWLPQSGYKLASGLDFERYDEDFKDFSPDSRFYIYVPIE